MTSRGELRFHPMTIDGRLRSFASFNNVNCPQGFLYFNKEVGPASEGTQLGSHPALMV